ncbi:hypothetical protein F7725_013721 [Dissostichus mawsoni]|uniref:Phytanoyl-CoA hydroxylase-interacting protein-like C-terminal domain-containing protein n=1 Tax=Dissostichus mawsoni TaxID=36200 RepID=A0A7J5YUZ7_DISMA|nr:hypothetical protein F7725_013721 [Dissostichus mawsoni]
MTVRGHWFLSPRTQYSVSVQTASKHRTESTASPSGARAATSAPQVPERTSGLLLSASEAAPAESRAGLRPPAALQRIPAETLFNQNTNVYFGDFYCMYTSYHYVVLVLAPRGSSGDSFCRARLPELDPESNVFLRRRAAADGSLSFLHAQDLILELIYTEAVDLDLGTVAPIAGQQLLDHTKIDLSCKVCYVS